MFHGIKKSGTGLPAGLVSYSNTPKRAIFVEIGCNFFSWKDKNWWNRTTCSIYEGKHCDINSTFGRNRLLDL